MEIPLHLSGKTLSVCIHARPDSREKIYLEYFDGHAYRRLGQVENGNTSFSFRLATEEDLPIVSASEPAAEAEQPQALETEPSPLPTPGARNRSRKRGALGWGPDATDFQQMQQTNSVYGSQELRIEAQDILDGTGKSVRCFTTGDTLRFQIQLAAHKAVRHFVAVVCIMTRSGKTVTQLFCTSEDLGISSIPENGHVTIGAELSPLRIGEGEYMVSIGIFKQCTMSKAAEEPSYCVSDRALFFKVEQPFGVKKGLEICCIRVIGRVVRSIMSLTVRR
ncbi:MAG: Wzt carbohydrate-binding domain-containing protein [Dysosmobacter welbionis]